MFFRAASRVIVLASLMGSGPATALEEEAAFRQFDQPETQLFKSPENGPLWILRLIPSDDHTRIDRVEVMGKSAHPVQVIQVPRMDQPLLEQNYFKRVESEPVSYYGFKILTKERVASATALHGKGIAAFWSFWKYNPVTQRFEYDELMSQIPDPRFLPDGSFQTWLSQDEAGWERSTFIYHNGQPEKTQQLEGRLEPDGYRCYETRYKLDRAIRKPVRCPKREELERPSE